ncbi:radical SAM family heme chaperone HemW [Sphingomonas sp. GlSt437]|uniref:radical SAM family heme chaperone HemW n=1 Tax=Sphingomonas sp. GlSt437 TaxID=3389970 RepID=UPI003A852967
MARVPDPIALYVHWPFCVSKCPYCDFNSHVRASVDQAVWRTALLADMAHEAALTPGRPIGSIFFGGGTPSLMPPKTVAAVIDAAARLWGLPSGTEITLEANPSSVEAARFADLAAAGVNRVSLGLQALDDEALKFLGRAHDVVEGLAALEVAQRHFGRVSFDLIYARPGQSLGAWEAELARALSLGTEHLSLYQLTIEPGTRFATEAAAGRLSLPDEDLAADLFHATRTTTAAAGLPAYEISNHARPGAESRHNLTYWRMGDYVGIGPGAHGRRGGVATVRHRKPENWLAAVASKQHGIAEQEALLLAQRLTEALVMGLRTREGVSLTRLAALGDVPVDQAIDVGAAQRLAAQGMVTLSGDRLAVTDAGMLVLNAILAEVAVG